MSFPMPSFNPVVIPTSTAVSQQPPTQQQLQTSSQPHIDPNPLSPAANSPSSVSSENSERLHAIKERLAALTSKLTIPKSDGSDPPPTSSAVPVTNAAALNPPQAPQPSFQSPKIFPSSLRNVAAQAQSVPQPVGPKPPPKPPALSAMPATTSKNTVSSIVTTSITPATPDRLNASVPPLSSVSVLSNLTGVTGSISEGYTSQDGYDDDCYDDAEEYDVPEEQLEREVAALEAAREKVRKLSAGPDPKATCPCYTVIGVDSPSKCESCGGRIDSILSAIREKAEAGRLLFKATRSLNRALAQERTVVEETAAVAANVEELEDLMDARIEELDRIQRDLQVMAEKVSDEIEKRTELQASKDSLQAELDELSQALRAEANMLKSDEARRRLEHESREKSLEAELATARSQLQMEQLRLREIKIKMEESRAVDESDGISSANPLIGTAGGIFGSTNSPVGGGRGFDPIDPLLLSEFKDFLTYGPTVKLNKLHTLPFMKNAYDDDVTPCLKFGGNPRTSTRRLIDAIVLNSCFVEDMTPAQISSHNAIMHGNGALVSAGAAPSSSSRKSGDGALNPTSNQSTALYSPIGGSAPSSSASTSTAITPTQAIFQKTVLERISTWSSSTTASSSAQSASVIPGACSTCGIRSTPSGANGPGIIVRHQFKISESPDDIWCPICQQCRDRLVASCEFYNFVRHIRQGLYSTRRHEDLYLEMLGLKRRMFFARMGAAYGVDSEKPFARGRSTRPDSALLRELEVGSLSSTALGGPAPAVALAPPPAAAGVGKLTMPKSVYLG